MKMKLVLFGITIILIIIPIFLGYMYYKKPVSDSFNARETYAKYATMSAEVQPK